MLLNRDVFCHFVLMEFAQIRVEGDDELTVMTKDKA